MSERERRLATNEALFRAVNEEMVRLDDGPLGPFGGLDIVCECARVSCAERIPLSREDYEWIRADPRRFAVRPGHVELEVERVVREEDGWVVVEKRDEDAADVAVETDGRS